MKKLLALFLLALLAVPALTYSQEKEAEKAKLMKPALIVIDVQNAFLPMMDQTSKEMPMQMINYTIDMFRKQGYPIIRVYHTSQDYGVIPDTEQFEYPSTVAVTKDDPKVIKTYGDAFNKTDLDKILKEKGVNTLFLCGLSATGCVMSTYIGAMNHDYSVFLIKDALLSPKAAQTQSIEEILGAINFDVVKVMLNNAQK